MLLSGPNVSIQHSGRVFCVIIALLRVYLQVDISPGIDVKSPFPTGPHFRLQLKSFDGVCPSFIKPEIIIGFNPHVLERMVTSCFSWFKTASQPVVAVECKK